MNLFPGKGLLTQFLGGFEPPISWLQDRRCNRLATGPVGNRFFDLILCVSVPSTYAI